jgi:hypothetical protein
MATADDHASTPPPHRPHPGPPLPAPATPASHQPADLREWIAAITREQAETRLLPLVDSTQLAHRLAHQEPFELTLAGDPTRPSENQTLRLSPVLGRPDRWRLDFAGKPPGHPVNLYGAAWSWGWFEPAQLLVTAVGALVERRTPPSANTPVDPRAHRPELQARADTGTFVEPPRALRPPTRGAPSPQIPSRQTPPSHPPGRTWFDGQQWGTLWLEVPLSSSGKGSCWGLVTLQLAGEPAQSPRPIALTPMSSQRGVYRGQLPGCPRPVNGGVVTVTPLTAADVWRLEPGDEAVTEFLAPYDFDAMVIGRDGADLVLEVPDPVDAVDSRFEWFLGVVGEPEGGAA